MKIMIIRHGEKPSDDGLVRGVSIEGLHDRHQLSVHGWQRAGALVRFFAPLHGPPPGSPVAEPRTIFASRATHKSPSLRSQQTVHPLAAALGLTPNHDYPEGHEAEMAPAVLSAPGPVLISWHHKQIPVLVHHLAGEGPRYPHHWPDERFDVVWVLDRDADGAWAFTQVAQQLLAHDRADVF